MSEGAGKYRWQDLVWPAVLIAGLVRRSTLPVTIYLSHGRIHDRVEGAVDDLLATAGLRVVARGKPVIGSWFRSGRARLDRAARSPGARELAGTMLHAADSRLVLAQDAAITGSLMQQLAPLLGSLQPTKDAVIRLGALLIVKVDWTVSVNQLTAVQQLMLDHQPDLATSPHKIIAALGLGDPLASQKEPT